MTENKSVRLTVNQEQVLQFLNREPQLTTAELAVKIGISKRKTEENIAKLKKIGRLERVGTAKGGYWKVVQN